MEKINENIKDSIQNIAKGLLELITPGMSLELRAKLKYEISCPTMSSIISSAHEDNYNLLYYDYYLKVGFIFPSDFYISKKWKHSKKI